MSTEESSSIAVLNAAGKIIMECVIETKAISILQFLHGLLRGLHALLKVGNNFRASMRSFLKQ